MSTFYVSNGGSDNNDGLSLSTAFSTIEKAVKSATEESTIFIEHGIYTIEWFPTLTTSVKLTIKALDNTNDNIPVILINSVGGSLDSGEVDIYNMIFKPSSTFHGDTRVLGYNTATNIMKFYNCLFMADKTNHVPTAAFFFFATSGNSEKYKYFYNCTFDNDNGSGLIGNNFAGLVHMYNCATSYNKSDDVAEFNDCVKSVTYTADHEIVSGDNTKYGVYSGDNAWTKLLCLLKSEGKYYSVKEAYYDTETKAYKEVTTDQFNDAMFSLNDLFTEITVNDETFKPITKFRSFKICASKFVNFCINGLKSTSEMVVGKSSFSTAFAENIDYFKLAGNKLDGIKLAVSIDDGASWKTYDSENSTFKDLEVTIPTSNYSDLSPTDIANWNAAKTKISTDGINASDLNTIDFNKLNSTKIKFAYVLTAASTTEMDSMKNLTWQFDAKGLLRQCTPDEATIEVNSNGVKITSKIDADILKTNILYES